ncbi:PfkB family carbohydrate kinase [Yinghuangia seranimata]|uniref:PfkB family carbohydrate kinase n=1 Tax=Yinghuangia seranimata TaxID=408067 RepID=UPI00248B28BF|nr:PfkB family carbohydrate kinase [Yinghuangia seranimata]MDI2125540.1 PfkB family carbohydrate kinase [Yinghuangia seranimata]
MPPTPRALFVGLCTLDVIQSVDRAPGPNEKVVALRQTVAAGGPAANAAATCAALNGQATLVTALGRHPLAAGARADLAGLGVRIIDTDPTRDDPPAISSVLVDAASGDRAVVSTNASGAEPEVPEALPDEIAAARVLLVDGHHMDLAHAAATEARNASRLVLFDGGSWKDGTEELLSHVDVAVCSADFRPPGAASTDEVLAFLLARGVAFAAVSRGPLPIRWRTRTTHGDLPVAAARVVDTVGAGDVLHGALAYALAARPEHPLTDDEFTAALSFASTTASRSCTAFGTREWMTIEHV